MSTLTEIFTEQNMLSAIAELQGRPNSCGSDGVMLRDLREYVVDNSVREMILNGAYEPRPVIQYQISSRSGGMRTISKLCSVDRMVLKLLQMNLSEQLDGILSDHCIAYRERYGTERCCYYIREALDNKFEYAVKIDIKNYFDRVSHDILFRILNDLPIEEEVRILIKKMVRMPVERNYRISMSDIGLIQGSSLSPLLSNIYLKDFDKFVAENITQCFYRFADDIAIFCRTREEAEKAYRYCTSYLQEKYDLTVGKRKSGIYPILAQTYLGFSIVENSGKFEVLKLRKNKRVFHYWKRSGLKNYKLEYEIISNGILTSADGTMLFFLL